jgi:hypothetical protein
MSSPSTSTLYANQQRLLRERSFQSLSSPTTSTLHSVLVRHAPIEVDHFSNCPNIYCTIPVQHTYYYNAVEPCPQDIPTVLLRRFHPNLNPFPNDMRYEVMEAPQFLLEHGCQAYIMGYGVVRLLEINVETTKPSKEWKVFRCIKGGEFVVAEIAAQKGWCRIHKRCLRLFRMPLPFSLSS